MLDKGIAIDASIRTSAVGNDLISVDARIIVASFDAYFETAGAVRSAPFSRLPVLISAVDDGLGGNSAQPEWADDLRVFAAAVASPDAHSHTKIRASRSRGVVGSCSAQAGCRSRRAVGESIGWSKLRPEQRDGRPRPGDIYGPSRAIRHRIRLLARICARCIAERNKHRGVGEGW